MERPALDEWMIKSAEVLAETEEQLKRNQVGKKAAEIVLKDEHEDVHD